MTTIREVLFKAKLKDWKTNPQQNKWVEGYYLSRKETTYCFTEDYERNPVKTLHYIAVDSMTDWGLPNEFRFFEIDPYTLCEYTGLTDDNENMIWENDILDIVEKMRNLVYGQGNFNDVRWENKSKFVVEFSPSGLMNTERYAHSVSISCKVIGNIFDNPEKGSTE